MNNYKCFLINLPYQVPHNMNLENNGHFSNFLFECDHVDQRTYVNWHLINFSVKPHYFRALKVLKIQINSDLLSRVMTNRRQHVIVYLVDFVIKIPSQPLVGNAGILDMGLWQAVLIFTCQILLKMYFTLVELNST